MNKINARNLLAKTLRENKIAMKKFLKNLPSLHKTLQFAIDFKLLVPAFMYKIKTHNISGARS